MIDPTDNANQKLPLEQPKRGRGRPATGKAMTPAEKQAAYRARQKSNVTDTVSRKDYDQLHAITLELAERCKVAEERLAIELESKAARPGRMAEGIEQINAELVAKVERLERELMKAKAKAAKAGPTKRRYVLQFDYQDLHGKTVWQDDQTGDYSSKRQAEKDCARMNEPGKSESTWRVRERQWV